MFKGTAPQELCLKWYQPIIIESKMIRWFFSSFFNVFSVKNDLFRKWQHFSWNLRGTDKQFVKREKLFTAFVDFPPTLPPSTVIINLFSCKDYAVTRQIACILHASTSSKKGAGIFISSHRPSKSRKCVQKLDINLKPPAASIL